MTSKNIFLYIFSLQILPFFYPYIAVVQLLSHVWLFVTPWTAAHQASLSFTISHSLPKFVSFESMMLSNYLILIHMKLHSIYGQRRIWISERCLRNLHFYERKRPQSAVSHVLSIAPSEMGSDNLIIWWSQFTSDFPEVATCTWEIQTEGRG